MEPGESLRVRAWGTSPGELTIELVEQGLLVRDWPDSVVCVSSVRLVGGLARVESQGRSAPAISIRDRLHPVEEDEDTDPGG